MSKKWTIWLMAAIIGILATCEAAFGEAGPVAYWRLDEGMGQTAYDWVGGYDGTLINDANWLTGIIGPYALEFDGDGDYVRTTYEGGPGEYTVSLWYNLNETIDCDTFDGYRALVSKTGDEHPTINMWNVWFAHGYGLQFANETATSTYSYVAYKPAMFEGGQWHHILVTGTSTEGKIYFDGELKSTAAGDFSAGTWDDSVPFDIGRPYGGNTERFLNGKIDDVIIFDRVLSGEEVAAIYGDGLNGYGYRVGTQTSINMIESVMAEKEAMLEKTQELLNREAEGCEVLDEVLARRDYGDLKKGDIIKAKEKAHSAMQHEQQVIDALSKSIEKLLDSLAALGWEANPLPEPLAWWNFDEHKGGIAYDSAGDNDGVLMGGVERVKGISKKGLAFDGVDDYVLGVTSPFDFANTTFAVSAWFKTETGGATIISEGAWLHGGWHVAIRANGTVGIMMKAANNSDAYSAYSTDSYVDGQWHHVAVVATTDTGNREGNHADVYLDGVLVAVSESNPYAYVPSEQLLTIGARSEGETTHFAGTLDEIMVFGCALTGEQIQQLYSSAK